MSKAELFKKIQELSFVKTELELFLDTHPESRTALEYYQRTVDELERALEEYQSEYGPLVAQKSSHERWDWVDSPWPWHMDANSNLGCRGNRRA